MAVSPPLHMLERELRGVFGSRLQSLVAYGQRAAKPKAPIRTMALVESLTEQDLRGCAARVASWHGAGLATPLLVPAAEFPRSLDAFPLEFDAILADHLVVAGHAPFDVAQVEIADVRRACEVQARGHLLHLREGFVEAAGNNHALAVLIVESAAPLSALLTALARLDNAHLTDAASAGRHAERKLSLPPGTIADVVKLAGVHEISAAEAERMFPTYLAAMQKLVDYVDAWK